MAMDVTLRQLRAFVAVLEAGSFSEAAKAMHLSQAALSGLIKELENRVGVRLLDRSTRSVAPSVVGEAFEPMARRVLASLDEALESLTNLKELRRGLVRRGRPRDPVLHAAAGADCHLQQPAIPASTCGSTTCRSSRCWRACRTAAPISASAGRRHDGR